VYRITWFGAKGEGKGKGAILQGTALFPATYIGRRKMRHFLLVTGAVAGNFILWALITELPAPDIIMFGLAIAVGCLMIYIMVHFGKRRDSDSST
jgi:hypothetical protein